MSVLFAKRQHMEKPFYIMSTGGSRMFLLTKQISSYSLNLQIVVLINFVFYNSIDTLLLNCSALYSCIQKDSQAFSPGVVYYNDYPFLDVRYRCIPPQACRLLVSSAKCRLTAFFYHLLTCGVCWSPRNTTDYLALSD